MKYTLLARLSLLCLLSVFFLIPHRSFAQSATKMKSDTIEPGVIRLKMTEAFADQLEKRPLTRTSDSIVQTGVQALDDLTQLYKVTELKRVVAPSGKFEAKHRKSGLHQWYEVRMDITAVVQEAVAAFGALPQVEKAEPVFRKYMNEAKKPSLE